MNGIYASTITSRQIELKEGVFFPVNMVMLHDLTIKRRNTTMDIWVCPEQGPQVRQFQLNRISET